MLLSPWFTPRKQAGTRMRRCGVSPSTMSLQKDLGRHLWTIVSNQNTSATCSEPQGGKAAMEGMLMPSPPLSELQLSITPLRSLAGPQLCQAVSKLSILPFGYLLPHCPLTQEHRAMAPGPHHQPDGQRECPAHGGTGRDRAATVLGCCQHHLAAFVAQLLPPPAIPISNFRAVLCPALGSDEVFLQTA